MSLASILYGLARDAYQLLQQRGAPAYYCSNVQVMREVASGALSTWGEVRKTPAGYFGLGRPRVMSASPWRFWTPGRRMDATSPAVVMDPQAT